MPCNKINEYLSTHQFVEAKRSKDLGQQEAIDEKKAIDLAMAFTAISTILI